MKRLTPDSLVGVPVDYRDNPHLADIVHPGVLN